MRYARAISLVLAVAGAGSARAALDTKETNAIIIFFVLLFLLLVALLIFLRMSLKIVRHAEVMLIERFGKFHKTLKPGWHILIPFVDYPRTIHWRSVYVGANKQQLIGQVHNLDRVDVREHVIDFGRQHVITKDTVSIDLDALVYYQITDPEQAVFKIQNLPDAIELLTQTTLRNIIAHMTLDDTFSSRELINSKLKESTKADAERWGVTITHVEIQDITPPMEIKTAMENQIREERERRSTVLTADGSRESSIIKSQGQRAKMVLDAEGDKTSALQRAKGRAEAKLLLANAEAESLKAIRQALESVGSKVRATDYLMAIEYLQTLEQMTANAKRSEVVLIPTKTMQELDEIQKPLRQRAVKANR